MFPFFYKAYFASREKLKMFLLKLLLKKIWIRVNLMRIV